MRTRRGRDEGSAPDSPRTDRAGAAATSGAEGTEGTWAPAETGGGLVSLDDQQFEALVRPFRDARRRSPSGE